MMRLYFTFRYFYDSLLGYLVSYYCRYLPRKITENPKLGIRFEKKNEILINLKTNKENLLQIFIGPFEPRHEKILESARAESVGDAREKTAIASDSSVT